VLSIILIGINHKIFLRFLKQIHLLPWLFLLVILVIFIFICVTQGLTLKIFNPSDAEWMEINAAHNLLNKSFNAQLPDRMVFPVILTFLFRIFGPNPLIVSVFNLFIAIISICLIFILTQIIFSNEIASCLSAFIYAFAPITLAYTSLKMGDPTLVGLFLLLFLISLVLVLKYHKFSLHVLTLNYIALASLTKPEYLILVIPYCFAILLFKEYKFFTIKQIILLILIFILFLLPMAKTVYHFKQVNSSGWCGYPSQTFHNGKFYYYSLSFLAPLNKIIKFFTTGRFSIETLIYDIPNFIQFWFSKTMFIVSLLIFGGLCFALRFDYKATLLILCTFLCISIVYLADCIFYETRLAFPTYGIIVVFSGLIVGLLFKGILKNKQIIKTLIICTLVIILVLNWYFTDNKFDFFNNYRSLYINYNNLKNLLSQYQLEPDDSYLIATHHTEKYILNFWDYDAICLTDLITEEYFQKNEKFWKQFQLPLEKGKNNYFIYSNDFCNGLPETTQICNFVKDNYTKAIIGGNNEYTIYSLTFK